MGFNKSKPIYSKFDHRILSHQLTKDLPTSHLKLVLDPVSELRNDWNQQTYEHSAAAKFDIEGVDVNGRRPLPGHEKSLFYSYLDGMMEEVPGKDNYGASITANGFDATIKSANPRNKGKILNGAHYHRPYKLTTKDAMGVDTAQRSYCDRVYVALTSQMKVAGPSYHVTDRRGKVTKTVKVKASYAVPIEIVYLTPLNKWNPFEIEYKSDCKDVTGTGTQADPFTAYCPERYFITPDSFYTGGSATSCSNCGNLMYFKSPKSNSPVCLRPSGIHTKLPRIKGIDGIIRQRYPIMPVNREGSSVWKKLTAIEDSVKFSDKVVERVSFRTGLSTHTDIPVHSHSLS